MSCQALLPALALIPASLIPASLLPGTVGHTGLVNLVSPGVLSLWFFYYSARLALQRSALAARRLLMASIIYLPLAFTLIVLAKF
jgi:heme O synthase-like polyprenyltransferase